MHLTLRYMSAPNKRVEGEFIRTDVELPDDLSIERLIKELGAGGVSPLGIDGFPTREVLTQGKFEPGKAYQLKDYTTTGMDGRVKRLREVRW